MRHFQTQQPLAVFKSKRTVVLVYRFWKLKRILFYKGPIFLLPSVKIWKLVKMFRNRCQKWRPYWKPPIFPNFWVKKKQSLYFLIFPRLRLKVLIHHCFPKSRAWKLRLQHLKNRKACFTSPTWPIWALSLLILGYSKRARIQFAGSMTMNN